MASRKSVGDYVTMLEDTLDTYLADKAPDLPPGLKEGITVFLPWIIIISTAISILGFLPLVGLSVFNTVTFGIFAGASFAGVMAIGTLFGIVIVVLNALSIPGLLNHTIKGWRLLYYSTLVGILMSFLNANFLGGFVVNLLFLYILFQIKDSYR